jgi:uncharacterized RDD family membrane protein YckC
MQASSSSTASAEKAGWWVRFFAYFVDSLIVGIPAAILGFIFAALAGGMTSASGQANTAALSLFYIILALASVAYFVYFWSQRDGQTIMNKAMNIKVVRMDGSPITVGTAIVRYIGYIINDLIFGIPIGFIWAAFDANKQGWHDKIAGTIVVKTS